MLLILLPLLLIPAHSAPNAIVDGLFTSFDTFVNAGMAQNISDILHKDYERSPPCGGRKVHKAADVHYLSTLPRGTNYSTLVYETMSDTAFFLVRVTFTGLFGNGNANVIVDRKPGHNQILAIYERDPENGCKK